MEEKRTAGAALLKQVVAENAVMIEQKKLEKAREVEENLRILAYMREQDAKALVSSSDCPSASTLAITESRGVLL